MIIKSNRISTGASRRRLVDHLLHGEENDYVEILQGSERDIADFWWDAQVHATAKALRVWILSPDQVTTREQAFEAVDALAREFDFDPSQATVVEHGKGRVSPDAFDKHWHVVVGEVDPATGRVLSSSHDRARHEFLARLLEAKWGHRFVLGAHTKAVLARLRRDGHDATADLLSAAFEPHAEEAPPREAYTTAQHQVAKRRGASMPRDREAVAEAWRSAGSLAGLTATLAASGLELSLGDVEWVVRRDGVLLGALMRLLKLRKAAFTPRMEELIHGNDIDATDTVLGGDGTIGDPTGAGGNSGPTPIRGPAWTSVGRRELHGGRDKASDAPRRRDRRNTPPPGDSPRDNDGARNHTGAQTRDLGGLIEDAAALVDAVVALMPTAEAVATPAEKAATVALDRYEAAEMRHLTGGPADPSTADLDEAKALAGAEQDKVTALNVRISALNREIGPLLRAQRDRRRSIWHRWFPDLKADAALERLRAQRDRLLDEHKILERPLLRALAAQSRTERRFVTATADAKAAYAKTISTVRIRLAAVTRARRVLELWPAIAYTGVKNLLKTSARIEKAKSRGWDPGPSFGPPK